MAGVSEHNNSDESEQSQSEEREVEEREDNALPCGIPDEGSPVWTWLLWGFFAVFLTIILGQTLIYSIFRGDITQTVGVIGVASLFCLPLLPELFRNLEVVEGQ